MILVYILVVNMILVLIKFNAEFPEKHQRRVTAIGIAVLSILLGASLEDCNTKNATDYYLNHQMAV